MELLLSLANIDSSVAYVILKLFGSEGGSDAYQVGLGHFLMDLDLHVVTLPAAIHLHIISSRPRGSHNL